MKQNCHLACYTSLGSDMMHMNICPCSYSTQHITVDSVTSSTLSYYLWLLFSLRFFCSIFLQFVAMQTRNHMHTLCCCLTTLQWCEILALSVQNYWMMQETKKKKCFLAWFLSSCCLPKIHLHRIVLSITFIFIIIIFEAIYGYMYMYVYDAPLRQLYNNNETTVSQQKYPWH